LSFDILSFDILSFDILSFDILSFDILSFDILSFEILSFDILSFDILNLDKKRRTEGSRPHEAPEAPQPAATFLRDLPRLAAVALLRFVTAGPAHRRHVRQRRLQAHLLQQQRAGILPAGSDRDFNKFCSTNFVLTNFVLPILSTCFH
jgi:hypothetical protein